MRGVFALLAVLAVAAGIAVPAALAAPGMSAVPDGKMPTAGNKLCAGTRLGVYTMDVTNDYDLGLAGNVWAGDDYRLQIVLYQVSRYQFCAAVQYNGTFTTREGTSPAGTSHVESGHPGRLTGSYRTTVFTARFRPGAPTAGGSLGAYDYGCDGTGTCGNRVSWTDLLFTGVQGFGQVWWQFIYDGGCYGMWVDRSFLTSGDVSG